MSLLPTIVGLGLAGPALAASTAPAAPGWMVDRWTVDDGLPLDHLNGLAHGADGRLYLATYDGLWSFDGRRFARVPVGGAEGTPGVRVHALERSPLTQDLWLSFDGGEVQRRGPSGVDTWSPRLPGPLELRLDAGGGLWAAGPEHCVALVDAADPTAAPRLPTPGTGTPGVPCPPGTDAAPPGPTDLRGGPLRITPQGRAYDGEALVIDLGHPVRDALWLDGQLWLATTGAGLVRLRTRVVEVVEAPEALSPIVTRLQWDAATGEVWARSHDDRWWSTADPGAQVEPPGLHAPAADLDRLDDKSLPFAPPRWDDAVRWWGTERELRRESADGGLEAVGGPRGFWQVVDTLPLPDGSLVLATTEGVWRLRPDGHTQIVGPDQAPVASVRSMVLLDEDTVAFGGGGPSMVGTIDLRTDRAVARALRSPVRHLRADRAWLWLATEGEGLCALPRDTETPRRLLEPEGWRCLDEAQGLGAAGVHASVTDDAGRVWLSANRGIGVVSAAILEAFAAGERDTVGVTWLGTEAGMRSAEANGTIGGAVSTSPDGVLHFPTQRGVARVVPERFVDPPVPHVVLDEVVIDGEPRVLDGGPIVLPAETRLVALRWSAVSLAAAAGVRVRHRMSGDASWSRPSADGTLSLRGLAPGEHALELQAGIGEQWGPVQRVALRRPPLLHERRGLWLAGLLAGLLALLLGTVQQRRRASRRAEALQRRVDVATEALRDARDALARDNETLSRQAETLDARNTELDQKNAALARQGARLAELAREEATRANQLQELHHLKQRLVANISHELRTPLTLIRGPIEVLAASEADPQRRQELDLAVRNAARLDVLVQDLLLLSRAESGALPLRAQRVSPADLLARVLGRFPPERLRRGPLPAAPEEALWCDPAMLDTALGNLISNALEHGGDAAPVEVDVALRTADGVPGLHIEVRDHGPGLAPADRASLFGRFEKGDHEGGGLGLGLALARELVGLHGGTLAHRAPPEGGACFEVWLPLGAAHLSVDDIAVDDIAVDDIAVDDIAVDDIAVAGVGVDGPEPPGGDEAPPGPTDASAPLLLVEDNAELRAFLATQLGTRHTVVAVEDAEAALAWLARTRPRVVVSDIMLPGMSGLELARRLRAGEHTADLPVLLVSARGEVEDRVRGLEVADDYLPKPFSVLELHARVDALVRRAGGPRSASPDPTAAPSEPQGPAWLDALRTRLREHVDAHIDDADLDAPHLAQAVAMSQRALSERLREAGLPSPAAWIREQRLDRAREMLAAGRFQTVGEVAAAVGMSRSYFSRAFKARFGVSPGDVVPPGPSGT